MNVRHTFDRESRQETTLPVAGIEAGLSDEELLDRVQCQSLRYFWDHAHPISGMARERKVDGKYILYDCQETVTTGGTGFGIMGMLVGAERGWLPRKEVCARVGKIVDFLNMAESNHGVFPHFINGRTGKANFFETMGEDYMPVASPENGGNLVETAFLFSGLLTARQYFSGIIRSESVLRDNINFLWENVEWDSHLSPDGQNLQWLNHPIVGQGILPVTGWNEAMITHVLAAASPTHSVSADVYKSGWASGKDFYENGESYYGINLPLGPELGGPLFFSHYSFMGLDPRGLKDSHANYWEQNQNHTLINRAYCLDNPNNHAGYAHNCWGLTASDTPNGYDIHKPDGIDPRIVKTDNGTIAPTAALSSFPYTPVQSMEVLRHFYEDRGKDLWTEYGFVDAFNPSKNWVANSHLAIDQGPIITMIENHRTGFVWDTFMSCAEIRETLPKLGFDSPHLHPKKDPEPALAPT